ncbi:hypothetical protein BH10PSE17_BH10PSE17_11780 [soil metagenome]
MNPVRLALRCLAAVGLGSVAYMACAVALVEGLRLATGEESADLAKLAANAISALCGGLVGYWALRRFAFAGTRVPHRLALLRFAALGAGCAVAIEAGLRLLMAISPLGYPAALALVLLATLITFIVGCSRWAFARL